MTERRLRIVHVVDFYMEGYGYQENLLPKWHVRHGHEVHVVTSDRYVDNGNYAETFGTVLGDRMVGTGVHERDGYLVHRLPAAGEWRTRVWLRRLRSTLKTLRPDVVVGHSTTSPTAFRLAAIGRSLNIPVVLDSHMVFSVADRSLLGRCFYALLRAVSRAYLAPRVAQFYGVAEECSAFLVEAQGIPESRVELLPLGIDPEIFAPVEGARERLRRTLGIAPDALVVLQTGKMTRDKGPDLLARAVADLARDGRDAHLVLVGSGDSEYGAEIRAPFDDLAVPDHLHQLPLVPIEELPFYFSASDVTVFPRASSLSSPRGRSVRGGGDDD